MTIGLAFAIAYGIYWFILRDSSLGLAESALITFVIGLTVSFSLSIITRDK